MTFFIFKKFHKINGALQYPLYKICRIPPTNKYVTRNLQTVLPSVRIL